MTSAYMLSRKLHRILVLMIAFLTAVMVFTGILMKYPDIAGNLDLGEMRYVHNQVSLLFAIVLAAMACTGLHMYAYPWYAKRKASASSS